MKNNQDNLLKKQDNILEKLDFKEGDKVWFRNQKGLKFIFKIVSIYLKPNKQPMLILKCTKAWGNDQYAMPALLFEKVPQEVLNKIEEAKARKLAQQELKYQNQHQNDQINKTLNKIVSPRKFKFERR